MDHSTDITSLLPALAGRRLLLASASPRRSQLLSLLRVPFTVMPLTDVDESYPADTPPLDVAPHIARKKALAAPLLDGDIIITADTVVIADGAVLGKPADADHASRMLHSLSGRTHTVVTGVAIRTPRHIDVRKAVTQVTFAPLSPDEIQFYITSCAPFDKAGAYGIQEWIGAIGISNIAGSYYNVMGLPLHLLYTMLRAIPTL